MGRPFKEISQKDFEKLCFLQCTEEEISAFLDVSRPTLRKWCQKTYGKNFKEVFAEKRQHGLISLRRNIFKQSEKNPQTAIFLAKNYLGMRDKFDVDQNIDSEIKIKIDYGDNEPED